MNTLKATGLRPGAPDLFVIYDGRFIGLEVKMPTGKLQNSQKLTADAIVMAGGAYFVVRSLECVWQALTAFGVPLRARPA